MTYLYFQKSIYFKFLIEIHRVLKIHYFYIHCKTFQTNQDIDEVIERCHRTECNFYDLMHDLNDGFAPLTYYHEKPSKKHPGVIIMEDLSQRCTTFGLFRSGTVEQLWSVARKIAHYQALVACRLKKEDWMGSFRDDSHTDKFHSAFYAMGIEGLLELEPSKCANL